MERAPTPSPELPDTITATLRMMMRGLMAALGAWDIVPALTPVLHNRISLTLLRIERMLVRFRAGTLARRAPLVGATGQTISRNPAVILPRRYGWLLRAGKHQAAYFHLQLQTVLNTPEMTELLVASPQAQRLLRPLCRALAVEMPGVAQTPRAARTPRARKPRPKPEPFRIPLPRGVLSWARREGFGKMV